LFGVGGRERKLRRIKFNDRERKDGKKGKW
jgi:hypothetical protein